MPGAAGNVDRGGLTPTRPAAAPFLPPPALRDESPTNRVLKSAVLHFFKRLWFHSVYGGTCPPPRFFTFNDDKSITYVIELRAIRP